jgi:hypothetical protein
VKHANKLTRSKLKLVIHARFEVELNAVNIVWSARRRRATNSHRNSAGGRESARLGSRDGIGTIERIGRWTDWPSFLGAIVEGVFATLAFGASAVVVLDSTKAWHELSDWSEAEARGGGCGASGTHAGGNLLGLN